MRLRTILVRLSALRSALSIVLDPNDTERVFNLVKKLGQDPGLKKRFQFNGPVQRFVDAPFYQDFPSLDELRAMPDGTLGRELSIHMAKLGVDFSQFDREHDFGSPHERLTRHLEETHDIWHVVTGFGTDVSGEVGLQAFYLNQTRGLPPLVLTTLGFMRLLADGQEHIGPRVEAVIRGWELAKNAETLIGIDWRPLLGRPLEDVRRQLRVRTTEQPWRAAA